MRWQIPILILFLSSPLLVAGCTTPAEVDDIPVALEAGEAYVRIYVKPPLGLGDHPIWELEATPRLIAFIAGDNDTRAALGDGGYVDLAEGWPDGWADANQSEAYPATATQNWMLPGTLWYEGVVPAGNYSVIRIEILDVRAQDDAGRDLAVQLMGDRLSIGPSRGDHFVITAGEAHSFVMESVIQQQGASSYLIQ